jgi:hypothetical protein
MIDACRRIDLEEAAVKGHGLQERLVAERDGRPLCIVVVPTAVGGVPISAQW